MKILILILFLGVSSHCWQSVYELERGNYMIEISNGRPISITPIRFGFNFSRSINLSGLNLTGIDSDVFHEVAYVEKLNLSNNAIEKLPPLIFSELRDLRKLSLANNKLHILNNTFVGLHNLKWLDLSNNQISSLTKADLAGLTKSTRIIVDGNPLKTLRVDTLDDPSQPRYVSPAPGNIYRDPWSDLRVYDKQAVDLSYRDSMHNANYQPFRSAWRFFQYEPFYVKVCKTDDGVVKSVSKAAMTESRGDCLSIDVSSESLELNLSGLGLEKFERGWFKVPKEHFQILNLANNSISEITPELLNDLPEYMTIVNLQNNGIRGIEKIENRILRKLYLDYNLITTIENGAFGRTNLTSISLNYNRLKNCDFARRLPTSIQELVLGGNEISEISEGSLANLKSLKHLLMPLNSVTRLPAGTFRELKQLRLIDLSNNLLETIEPGTFEHQEKLSTLILSDNYIQALNSGIFEGLKIVDTLDLRNNRIRKISKNSFTGLKKSKIYKLILSYNDIDIIEEGSFANMTIELLLLSENIIQENSIEKGAFASCTLNTMFLSSNLFTNINGDSFYGILVYGSIIFDGNKMKTIKNGTAKYMGGVRKLDLMGTGVKRIENGAFYGFRKGLHSNIIFDGSIKVIQGAVFDEV